MADGSALIGTGRVKAGESAEGIGPGKNLARKGHKWPFWAGI